MLTIQKLAQAFRIFPTRGGNDPETKKSPGSYKIKDEYQSYIAGGGTLKAAEPKDETSWKQYYKRSIDLSFISGQFGVLLGIDGLEVLDIDNHFGDADDLLKFVQDNSDIVEKLPIIKTGGGGYHVYYKCTEQSGSTKLAMKRNPEKIKPGNPEGWDAFFETKGENSYVVFYNNVIQGDILNVPVISATERQDLHDICRSMDEKIIEPPKPAKKRAPSTEESPLDKYINDPWAISETIRLLTEAGWSQARSKGGWIRPGKKKGIGATFGRVGVNKFYVFTPNAHPFEPSTEKKNDSYSMIGVRALLLHNNDFSECAKELAAYYKPTQSKEVQRGRTVEFEPDSEIPILSQKWAALYDVLGEWKIKLRRNELTKQIDFSKDGKKYTDDVTPLVDDIVCEMENFRGIKAITDSKVYSMMRAKMFSPVYNPLLDWLKDLPKADGKDHLKTLCDCITLGSNEDRMFFETMLKKHLIRAVRCALEPEYTPRIVLVLHGRQEIGKSKIWEWLTPRELYSGEPIDDLKSKDTKMSIAKNFIMNLDDLDGMSKWEVGKLKAFISKPFVNLRLPYAKSETRMDRIASMVGTTNETDILTDDNNTRWLILKVSNFDWKTYTKTVKADNIWSQVLAMYKANNEAGELTEQEKKIRDRRNNSEFMEINEEYEILQEFFTVIPQDSKYGLTYSQVKRAIERDQDIYMKKGVDEKKLRAALKRLCGESVSTSVGGKGGRYYRIMKNLGKDEVDMNEFLDELNKKAKEKTTDLPF